MRDRAAAGPAAADAPTRASGAVVVRGRAGCVRGRRVTVGRRRAGRRRARGRTRRAASGYGADVAAGGPRSRSRLLGAKARLRLRPRRRWWSRTSRRRPPGSGASGDVEVLRRAPAGTTSPSRSASWMMRCGDASSDAVSRRCSYVRCSVVICVLRRSSSQLVLREHHVEHHRAHEREHGEEREQGRRRARRVRFSAATRVVVGARCAGARPARRRARGASRAGGVAPGGRGDRGHGARRSTARRRALAAHAGCASTSASVGRSGRRVSRRVSGLRLARGRPFGT